jgi:cytochrome c oxidase subunit 1
VTATAQHAPASSHRPSPTGGSRSRFRSPGHVRALLFLVLGVLFAAGLVLAIRALYGFPISGDGKLTTSTQDAILLVSLIAAPLFWLVGLGAFDYWFYWAAGRKTRPEDHSSHGAYSWRDYLRVNTDHKVIGIQYVCTSFIFMLIGGMLAMVIRAELAAPGRQFVDASAYNGLFSVHASLMIFLFIIPIFAGLANYGCCPSPAR